MTRHEHTERRSFIEQLRGRAPAKWMAAGALALVAGGAGCGDTGNGDGDGSRTGAEAVRGRAGTSASSGGRAGGVAAGNGGATAPRAGTGGAAANAGSKGAAMQTDRNLGPCRFTGSTDWRTQDDKLLVYCDKNLGLLPLGGQQFMKLASPSNASDIAMSAERLLFVEAMQLTSVPLTGGDPTRVLNVIDGLQYSADRTFAVFEGAQASSKVPVFAIDPKTTESRKVVEAAERGARLLPDNRHLIYSPDYGEVAIVDAVDASAPKRLGNGMLGHVAFPKSGSKLAFYDSTNDHVVLAKVDGTTMQLGEALAAEPEVIAFAPDEAALLVADNNYDPPKARSVVLSLDGKQLAEIARGKNVDKDWLFISERGRIVSLQTVDNQSTPELWLASATGGESKMIGTLEHCPLSGNPPMKAYDADPPRMAFVDAYGSFVVVDLDTGERKTETKNLVPVGSTCYAAPSWSPDGKRVLLSICKSSTDCEIVIMDAGDGRRGPTLITDAIPATDVAFSKDARYVAFTSGSYIALFDATGPQLLKQSTIAQEAPYAWVDAKRFVVALDDGMHLLTLP